MTRRDKIGATLHLDLHTTDSVTKANVEQNNEDTVVRQFIESPEIPPSHHSDPPFHPQQQHTDTHIFVISSNRNMLQRSSKKRRFLHSTFLLKTSTLVLCLQSVSSHFYSVLSHFLVGASIQRKLSPQAAMATKAVKMVKSVNFRQPRVIQVGSSFHNVESLVNGEQYKESEHEIKVSERARKAKNSLDNSYQYKKWQKDPIAEGCEAMREWQEASYLTCNKIHEVDFLSQAWYLGRGGLNAVFKMTDIDGAYVIKILRYKRDYTDRNFDRVRRDSLVMERATSSKYVIDMYTFCGFSQIIEFGKDGGLDYWMEDGYDDLSQDQKLQIATQISQSLTDVHNLDGDGISSITHGDIAAKQYILIDGIFKLNDFNRGRLIHWNDKKEEPCPYTIRSNDGKVGGHQDWILDCCSLFSKVLD